MLRRPAKMTEILQAGGPFVGDNAATTRVTVQPNWYLTPSNGPVGNYPAEKLPIYWWQAQAGGQTEIEIPNLKTVVIDRQLTQDAATIEIDFYNTNTPANGQPGDNPDVFGQPGYLAWNFGGSPLSKQKWGQTPNAWKNLLREGALCRVYQGYGGWTDPATGDPLTITEAVANGNIMLTGVFIIDSIAIEAGTSGGMGKLIGRDMAALLIDQPIWSAPAGVVPQSFYSAPGNYGVGVVYYHDKQVVFPKALGYAAPGETSPLVDQTSPLEGFPLYVNDMAPYVGGDGYWIVGSDGGVFSYGYSYFQGSEGDTKLSAQMVSIDSTAGQGYWCASQDGGVFAFGDAPFLGNAVGDLTSETIVSLRRTQSGRGYWLCSNKGNVFCFGDAVFHGSLGGTDTIVGFTPRPQGDGYWMLATSGAVYSYGAATYYGGANPLSSDTAAGIDSDALGTGYRIVTHKGVVSAYGTAQMYTVTSGNPVYEISLNAPISGIRRTPSDRGWWLVGQDGGVFTYGDAQFWGSMPGDFTATFSGNYCADEQTEILTRRGWLRWDEVQIGDHALALDPATETSRWEEITNLFHKSVINERMIEMRSRGHSSLTTPEHKWLAWNSSNRATWTTSANLKTTYSIPVSAPYLNAPTEATYSDAFVEIIAWFWTEGSIDSSGVSKTPGRDKRGSPRSDFRGRVSISQSPSANPDNCSRIVSALENWLGPSLSNSIIDGDPWRRDQNTVGDSYQWRFCAAARDAILAVCPNKVPTMDFLLSLTNDQLEMFIQISIDADGHRRTKPSRCTVLSQQSEERIRAFEIACHLAGYGTSTVCSTTTAGKRQWSTTVRTQRTLSPAASKKWGRTEQTYSGVIWCPTTKSHTWLARRGGTTYYTGNSDYSDIATDICLWAGWWLQGNTPSNAPPTVFGLVEKTGAYDALGPIDSSLFDKVQCIDAIKSLKDVVGFIFRVREDGSIQFTMPNIWSMGNFYDDNTPTSYIPTFDEKLNITDWIQTNSSQSLRSAILVSSVDPYLFGGHPNNVTVTYLTPPNIQSLHGIRKPAMIGVPLNVPISFADQDLMAELQAIQCWLGVRSGQLNSSVDPAVCIDDQIQVFERSSGETGIHYVTGIHTEHDLDAGTWLGTYTTSYLGEPSNWAITTSQNGVLTDTTFDANGNINYQDSFPISQNLLNFLASSGSARTQHFKIGYVDGTGDATAIVPGVV